MTAAKMPHEADRQLPVGGEIFLDHVGHFVARPAGGERGAGARRLRADAGVGAVQSRRHADRHRQRHRDVHARLYRGAVQDRRHAARPGVRGRAGRPCRRASRRVLGRRCAGDAPAAGRCRLRDAAAGAVPASGRHGERAGHRGLHGGAARARRDGGGPHPVARAPHRGHGVAEALADASQRRAGLDRSAGGVGRCRGGGGALRALHRPRSQSR